MAHSSTGRNRAGWLVFYFYKGRHTQDLTRGCAEAFLSDPGAMTMVAGKI